MKEIHYAIFFVYSREEVRIIADAIEAKISGDAVMWFCYPKKSSKNYHGELTQDDSWGDWDDLA